ncbi:MAG TPA: hypothetical protein V6C86_16250 [Oculatellaceae cyanobacterium]
MSADTTIFESCTRRLVRLFLACFFFAALCSGCTNSSVTVDKAPPTVQTVHKNVRSSSIPDSVDRAHSDLDLTAYTTWFFGCKPIFDYQIVSEREAFGQTTTTLVIQGVNLQLSLPITIDIAKDALPSVVEHENGHVQICLKMYEHADATAREAARKLIGRPFTGTGATAGEARQKALDAAGAQLGADYRQGTVDEVNEASAYYDQLAAVSSALSVDDMVRQSIEKVVHSKIADTK